MTSQTSLGDLLDAAQGQITATSDPGSASEGGEDLREAGESLRSLVVVLRRFAQDAVSAFGTAPDKPRGLSPWIWAAASAQHDLSRAAGHLATPPAPRINPGVRPAVTSAGQIDSATALLRAGRDLLDTHFEARPDGSRAYNTEWAPALTSPDLRRALLCEIASLSRATAASCERLADAPGWRGAPGPRAALRSASLCLRTLDDTVQISLEDDPVPAADRKLLRAVPASMLPPRRQPAAEQEVRQLCAGVIVAAQRARRAAWTAARQPAAAVTISSLRHVASASTVTSHHCELLLRAAAVRAGKHISEGRTSQDMTQAADLAGRARAGWLNVARYLDHVTTIEPRAAISPAASEATDLALWTGRLAYADPAWTLASGPGRQLRQPVSLAPGPADLPLLAATVHYTTDTLEAIAAADYHQIRAASNAGRLLVPTRSVPRALGTQPLMPLPADRARDLFRAYGAAGRETAATTAAVSAIASSLKAPSRILTRLRRVSGIGATTRWRRAPAAVISTGPRWPGPLETSVKDLGVTNTWLVQRAAELDRASAELIMDAAEAGAGPKEGPATALGKSPAATAIVNDILASGDPRGATLFRAAARGPELAEPPAGQPPEARAAQAQRDEPEREP
jgi:hypothetical protein